MATTSNSPSPIKKKTSNEEAPVINFEKYASNLLIIGFIAAIISWYRNSGSNIIVKIFYALIAYLFNVLYIVYIIYKWFTYKAPAPLPPPQT